MSCELLLGRRTADLVYGYFIDSMGLLSPHNFMFSYCPNLNESMYGVNGELECRVGHPGHLRINTIYKIP